MAASILNTSQLIFTSDGSTILCRQTATADTLTFVGDASSTVNLLGIATPTTNGGATNKAYVDNLVNGVANGIKWKDSVIVGSVANGAIATAFANGQTVNGVTLTTGDRILLKAQSDGIQNGIYVVENSGAPTRSSDMATGSLSASVAVFLSQGSVSSDTAWVCTNDDGGDVVGTDALIFTQFSSSSAVAGSDTQIQFNNSGFFGASANLIYNGTNLQVLDDIGVAVGTGVDFTMIHNGTDTLVTSSTGDLTFDNTNVTGSTIMLLGTDTTATDFQIQNNSAAPIMTVLGSGITQINNATQSTASTNGCLVLTGGLGIAKDVFVAGDHNANTYNATSDIMLKTNIKSIESPLTILNKIECYSYNWKTNPTGTTQYGVMAQQLESIGLGSIVNTNGQGFKGVNYNSLIPFLIDSIKILNDKIDKMDKMVN